MKPFAGHHLDSQRLNDDMWLNMSSLVMLVRGPEKTSPWAQNFYPVRDELDAREERPRP